MPAHTGRLLVTRPRRQAQGFARLLRQKGYACAIEPMMRIVGSTAWSVPDPHAQAIIVTSANAVAALPEALTRLSGAPLIVAVGPDTAAVIRRAGLSRLLVAQGTVESVADLIIDRLRPEDGALLHLAGYDVAGDLGGQLGRHGFRLDRVTVYRAEASESLSPSCVRLLRGGKLDGVMLFSPRTAAIFADLVRRAGLEECLRDVAALVISSNAAAACGAGWRDIHVAAAPSREAMAALAVECLNGSIPA